ncbi:uncharacterized protein LOC124408778 isoform X2 [Diprion similis]|uniref:uncharacterized protein LOC124408778 isoform X2 n=1 Tax=Diprion similis TaxID=362088 RepID=UPI001EF7D252|nr:uncharacterized protein LOC124408778 isoform X2 [Diprion similis]
MLNWQTSGGGISRSQKQRSKNAVVVSHWVTLAYPGLDNFLHSFRGVPRAEIDERQETVQPGQGDANIQRRTNNSVSIPALQGTRFSLALGLQLRLSTRRLFEDSKSNRDRSDCLALLHSEVDRPVGHGVFRLTEKAEPNIVPPRLPPRRNGVRHMGWRQVPRRRTRDLPRSDKFFRARNNVLALPCNITKVQQAMVEEAHNATAAITVRAYTVSLHAAVVGSGLWIPKVDGADFRTAKPIHDRAIW